MVGEHATTYNQNYHLHSMNGFTIDSFINWKLDTVAK
jgi:hypothetical protein